MVRIFDQTEMASAWLCDNTDYIHLTGNEEAELFLASLIFNLRSARMSAGPSVRIPTGPVTIETETVSVEPEKKKKTKKTVVVVPPPDVDPTVEVENCPGNISIEKEAPCNNGECKGKKKKECVEKVQKKVKEKVEEKQEKGPRKLDKFGFDVNSNTGKMNSMLVLGEFSKKEIVEKLGCAEGSLNVHFANLRKKGFKLKENKEGKWKLTKTKIK